MDDINEVLLQVRGFFEGDGVRIRHRNEKSWSACWPDIFEVGVGSTGEIVEIDQTEPKYMVKIHKRDAFFWFYENELELSYD